MRSKFEENELDATEFLKDYFPLAIDPRPYRVVVDNEIHRMIDCLEKKFKLDSQMADLKSFKIEAIEAPAESLTFINPPLRKSKSSIDPLLKITSKAEELLIDISELADMQMDQEDIDNVIGIKEQLVSISKKYDLRYKNIKKENDRIEEVATIIAKTMQRHTRNISDGQKKRSTFSDDTNNLKDELLTIIGKASDLAVYEPKISKVVIEPNHNKVMDYEFISKLKIDKIDTQYIKSKIKSQLKSDEDINWSTITKAQLQSKLLRYDEKSPILSFFREKISASIDQDFQIKNSIINEGADKYAEMSSGLNSKIYFDLLSYENSKDGIYIIDQPEDNISQSAIRDYLLDRFKTMSENRQVIIVTHNPQFIVNLDIDNLIYLSKQDGSLQVQSGALEYVCDEYNILDIVVHNIDGGLNSIRKRWKRYDKSADL